jgi:hypothetical protein
MLNRHNIRFAAGTTFNAHGVNVARQHYGALATHPSLLARLIAWLLEDF